ncbi:MAG: hypothetical protein ACQCN6_09985 [Candidatus Bathyarchaeia archaeon]
MAQTKVALYVCCGAASPLIAAEGTSTGHDLKEKYLDQKAAQYSLQPIALGFFGGIYNYNKVPWWAKKALNAQREKIASAYKETEPNVYDTRDLDAIRAWAKELAQKTRQA